MDDRALTRWAEARADRLDRELGHGGVATVYLAPLRRLNLPATP